MVKPRVGVGVQEPQPPWLHAVGEGPGAVYREPGGWDVSPGVGGGAGDRWALQLGQVGLRG